MTTHGNSQEFLRQVDSLAPQNNSFRRPAEVIDSNGKEFYFFRRPAELIDERKNSSLKRPVNAKRNMKCNEFAWDPMESLMFLQIR